MRSGNVGVAQIANGDESQFDLESNLHWSVSDFQLDRESNLQWSELDGRQCCKNIPGDIV